MYLPISAIFLNLVCTGELKHSPQILAKRVEADLLQNRYNIAYSSELTDNLRVKANYG